MYRRSGSPGLVRTTWRSQTFSNSVLGTISSSLGRVGAAYRRRYADSMAPGFLVGALLAAVVIGGDFGVASATGEPAVGNRILVNLEVEVLTSADVVVAHLIHPGQDQETISLVGDDAGVFRGAATVPKVDIVVVFEAVRGPGNSSLSVPASLTELGLDPVLLGDLAVPIEESVASESLPGIGVPLTIAIVSGVLSIVLIVWWVWSGSARRGTAGQSDFPPPVGPGSGSEESEADVDDGEEAG